MLADLILLMEREAFDDPVQGLEGRGHRQAGEDELTGLCGAEQCGDRLGVGQGSDGDDFGTAAQAGDDAGGDTRGVAADFTLIDDSLAVGQQVFDRILDGDDVDWAMADDVAEKGRLCAGFAVAGGPGDEDQAGDFVAPIKQAGGQFQILSIGKVV